MLCWHLARCFIEWQNARSTLPCRTYFTSAIDMGNIIVGKSVEKLLSKVALTNNAINRRIQNTTEDLDGQLIEKYQSSGIWIAAR
ncbi:hypothetical protein CEXT_59501 [Caerostris extrusa]|uniref:Uncharacterized protein n=1 Tax=Caerostris extrusa TaxID=172846 RepID=A0AAV4SAD9_CAEEX|nr:hypothetical protein CEXT_59501 [Caerostris extrusa]